MLLLHLVHNNFGTMTVWQQILFQLSKVRRTSFQGRGPVRSACCCFRCAITETMLFCGSLSCFVYIYVIQVSLKVIIFCLKLRIHKGSKVREPVFSKMKNPVRSNLSKTGQNKRSYGPLSFYKKVCF